MQAKHCCKRTCHRTSAATACQAFSGLQCRATTQASTTPRSAATIASKCLKSALFKHQIRQRYKCTVERAYGRCTDKLQSAKQGARSRKRATCVISTCPLSWRFIQVPLQKQPIPCATGSQTCDARRLRRLHVRVAGPTASGKVHLCIAKCTASEIAIVHCAATYRKCDHAKERAQQGMAATRPR